MSIGPQRRLNLSIMGRDMPDIYSSDGSSTGSEGTKNRRAPEVSSRRDATKPSPGTTQAKRDKQPKVGETPSSEQRNLEDTEASQSRKRKLVIAQPVDIPRLYAGTKKIKEIRARVQKLKAEATPSVSARKPKRKLW